MRNLLKITFSAVVVFGQGFEFFDLNGCDLVLVWSYRLFFLRLIAKFLTQIVLSVHKLNKLGKFWWIHGQLLSIMSLYGWYQKKFKMISQSLTCNLNVELCETLGMTINDSLEEERRKKNEQQKYAW